MTIIGISLRSIFLFKLDSIDNLSSGLILRMNSGASNFLAVGNATTGAEPSTWCVCILSSELDSLRVTSTSFS